MNEELILKKSVVFCVVYDEVVFFFYCPVGYKMFDCAQCDNSTLNYLSIKYNLNILTLLPADSVSAAFCVLFLFELTAS